MRHDRLLNVSQWNSLPCLVFGTTVSISFKNSSMADLQRSHSSLIDIILTASFLSIRAFKNAFPENPFGNKSLLIIITQFLPKIELWVKKERNFEYKALIKS